MLMPVCAVLLHMLILCCSKPIREEKAALIIIDVQNCFVAGGTLAVTNGNDVMPVINELRQKYESRFSMVVLSQDWHCSDHVSFASQHQGKVPYNVVYLQYNQKGELCSNKDIKGGYSVSCAGVAHNISQSLWPDHCVINTTDANFASNLTHLPTDLVVRKGYRCQVDSYSAFYDNGGFEQTELNQKLQEKGISTVYITGLATDFCVYYTSLDALKLKYKTYMVEDATRGVAPALTAAAIADMKQKGVYVISSDEVGVSLPAAKPPGGVEKAALIIIDVQNCFLPGGSLAVKNGNEVIPVINKLRADYGARFSMVVLSQDWHCKNHVSFASQHQGYSPYNIKPLNYNKKGSLCRTVNVTNTYAVNCTKVTYTVKQTLWPDHCLIDSTDAKFSTSLKQEATDVIIRKGYHCHIDSYSAFFDNGGFTNTELDQKLKAAGITTVYVTGLARDYCVYYTSVDAKKLKYKTYMVLDATRGVADGTSKDAVEDMKKKGIYVINSTDVRDTLPAKGPTSAGVENSCLFSLIFMFGLWSAYNCVFSEL